MKNYVNILGNLGQDPDFRTTQGNHSVCTLSVATNRTYTVQDQNGKQKKTETTWHRVVVWGKQAEGCRDYLKKGKKVDVTGRLATREYEQDGERRWMTEIVATRVIFLDRPSGNSRRDEPHPADMPGDYDDPPPNSPGDVGFDDLPAA